LLSLSHLFGRLNSHFLTALALRIDDQDLALLLDFLARNWKFLLDRQDLATFLPSGSRGCLHLRNVGACQRAHGDGGGRGGSQAPLILSEGRR